MILIITKEDTVFGARDLIQSLKKRNIEVKAFAIQPYDSLVSHPSLSILRDVIEYKQFLKCANQYSANLTFSELDAVSGWISSSTLNISQLTGRDWIGRFSFDDLLAYLNNCASFYDWVLTTYKPKALIDLESDNLIRAILDIVRLRYRIPYKVFYSTRLINRVTIADGVVNPQFEDPVINDEDVAEADELVSSFVRNARLSRDEQIFDTNNSRFTVVELLRSIIQNSIFHSRIFIRRDRRIRVKPSQENLFFGGGLIYLIWKIKYLLRRYAELRFFGSNIDRKRFKENYNYFALGQIVEGSEPNFSGGYLTDIECLNLLKTKLKVHRYPLLVKDHRSMVGSRTKAQRIFIDSLSIDYVWGRQLIEEEWLNHPQELVFNARAVFTLSGSVGLEALIAGVPTFIFGDPLYKKIMLRSGVSFPSLNELDEFLSNPEIFRPCPRTLTRSIAKLLKMSREYSLYQLKRKSSDDIEYDISPAVEHLLYSLKIDNILY